MDESAPDRRGSSGRDDRRKLLLYGGIAASLYAGAFALLAVGGAERRRLLVWVAALALALAAILLQLIDRWARERGLLDRRLRLWIPVGLIIAGLALGAYSLLGSRVENPTGGWALCGLCAAYLGIGLTLAELRSRRGGAPMRGVWVMVACTVLFAAGTVLCLAASAGWLILTGAALLLGPIGLALLSEDALRAATWKRARRGWLALALLLVAAGVSLLVAWTDVSWSLAWPLAVILFVLVGAIASDTQADVLLVVTVVALIWGTAPRGVAPGDVITPAGGEPTLVSLGDSYMSGEGAAEFFEGTNAAGRNECRRSPTAYAHRVVEEDSPDRLHRLAFYACSGALTYELFARAQWPEEPIDGTPESGSTQLEQLEMLLNDSRADIRLVVVSIGGNDAGFADIAMACLGPGSCVERGQLWLDRLSKVGPRISRAYREIRRVVGTEVPVLAVPYPQPISDQSCSYSLLHRDEHRFLHGFVQELNGAVQQSALDSGFYYLRDMATAFADDLRICDAPKREIGVNFIALASVEGVADQILVPSRWIHNSLHPNERGHEAMASVLESWLRDHPAPASKPKPDDAPERYTPRSLESLMQSDRLTYCGGPKDPPDFCDRDDQAWTVTQIGILLRDAAPPALLLVAGSWLLWLQILAGTRPWWRRLGARIRGLL